MNMKQGLYAVGLSMALLMAAPAAFAADLQGVVVDGRMVDLAQGFVFTEGENTIVPLRPTAETLGFEVVWDSSINTVTLDNQSIKTTLTVGQDSYYKQSNQAIGLTQRTQLGYAPTVIEGRVYVPLSLYNLLLSDEKAVRVEGDWAYISSSPAVTLPNPITNYASLEAVQEACGFEFKTPALPEGYVLEAIFTIAGDTVSINYVQDDQRLNFRVSQRDEDISGVYTVYEQNDVLENADVRGNGEQVNVALLRTDGLTYSLYSETGLSPEDAAQALRSLQ